MKTMLGLSGSLAFLGFVHPVMGELLYGVNAANRLITFDSRNPNVEVTSVAVTGLGSETLVAIDVRAATGEVYGYGSGSQIFRINPQTGVATALPGTFPVSSPVFPQFVGFDFQWANDRIRVTGGSLNGSNFRVFPDSGQVFSLTTPMQGFVADTAYGLDLASPDIPRQFGLGFSSLNTARTEGVGRLSLVGGDSGSVSPIGPLGLSISTLSPVGLDISLSTGSAYAVFDEAGGETQLGLYQIDLATGAATFLGATPDQLLSFSTAAVPEPRALTLLFLGIAALALRWKQRQ